MEKKSLLLSRERKKCLNFAQLCHFWKIQLGQFLLVVNTNTYDKKWTHIREISPHTLPSKPLFPKSEENPKCLYFQKSLSIIGVFPIVEKIFQNQKVSFEFHEKNFILFFFEQNRIVDTWNKAWWHNLMHRLKWTEVILQV